MPLSPRWRWKLQRFQNSVEEFKEQVREFLKTAAVKQKICPACRALVGANETRCPFCNEFISPLNRIGVRRVTAGFLPEMSTTHALVAINFLLFGICLVAVTQSGDPWSALVSGFPASLLVRLGSNYGLEIVFYGQYWRLLTGAFLHANLIHLLFNMLVLGDVGQSVEEMYGSTRFISLYVWTALCGSLVSHWWRYPMNNMVGASGAIFGLFGVMIAYGYRHRTGLAEQIRSMFIRWAIYGLVFGFLMGADNAAHIGGLAGGFAFGFFVSDMPPVTKEAISFWRILSYLSWLAIAGSLALMALNMALAVK
jgi:rhomboid protease GluP